MSNNLTIRTDGICSAKAGKYSPPRRRPAVATKYRIAVWMLMFGGICQRCFDAPPPIGTRSRAECTSRRVQLRRIMTEA